MAYKIVFKGNVDDVFIDDVAGFQLAQDFKEGSLDEKVNIGGSIYDSSAIKAVISKQTDPDRKEYSGNDLISKINADVLQKRSEKLRLSPKERAKSTAFFNMLSQSLRGRPLTEQEKADVRAAQEQWFIDHPDFDIANPICYFTREEMQRRNSSMRPNVNIPTSIKDALTINSFNLAERVLNN